LLARISNARPKVADYPFTTVAPVLGTVDAPDGTRQLTVADVPGLIEGASEGVGLGHEFLAHLERANLLLHVIDSSEDDAAERFATIDAELAAYGAGLETRAQAIVLNKIDLRAEPPSFDVQDKRIVRVFRVSCATGAGIDELKRELFELCPPRATAPVADDGLVDFLVYRPRPGGRRFRVLRTDRGFRIAGVAPTDEEELAAALKAAGARKGDEVEVDGEVLELQ
jgi:GTP-binding protein